MRIRFHFNNTESVLVIIKEMNRLIKPYVDQLVVDSVLTDTYTRELERYGSNSIEITEDLFFFDSQMIIDFIDIFKENEGDDIRWLFALRAIDALLEGFGFADSKKLELLHFLKEEFGKEYSMNKSLKLQLDKKYRSNMEKIVGIFYNTQNTLEVCHIIDLLKVRSDNTKELVQELKLRDKVGILEHSLFDLLPSYIHMMINRLFKTRQRQHELVIYNFLFKYYTSEIAKNKRQISVSKNVSNLFLSSDILTDLITPS